MVNNLENKIFLFLGINKFTIVAINSTNEFIYKGETLINNQNNQIELDFLDNFLKNRLSIFPLKETLRPDFFKNSPIAKERLICPKPKFSPLLT